MGNLDLHRNGSLPTLEPRRTRIGTDRATTLDVRGAAPASIERLAWDLSTPEQRRALVAEDQLDGDIMAALRERADDPAAFRSLIETAFADRVDDASLERLRRSVLDGSFVPPRVRVVEDGSLRGAAGAYASDTDTIYVDAALVGTATGAATLAEELGHAIDARLGPGDAAGDEGEVFGRLLAGESLDRLALAGLRAETDHGEIVVDGRRVRVEFRHDGGYTGPDYPWNPGGVANGGTPSRPPETPARGGYTGPDYPWNPGGVANGGTPARVPARPDVAPPPTPRTVAAIDLALHFDLFDDPHGNPDGIATEADIVELAAGDYDRAAAGERLIEGGVDPDAVDTTLDGIETTARLIRDDEAFRTMLDIAFEGGSTDERFSVEDAETVAMRLTVTSAHPDAVAARETIVRTRLDLPHEATARIDEVLAGTSHLGELDEAEQRVAIDTALDAWLPREAYAPRFAHEAQFLLRRLADGDDADLHRLATDLYVERSVALVDAAAEADWREAEALRLEATALSGSVLYSVFGDEARGRELIDRHDEPTLLGLVDALALDRTTPLFDGNHHTVSGETRAASAMLLIGGFDGEHASARQHLFTRAVFTSLPGERQGWYGESTRAAFARQAGFSLTEDLADDPAAWRIEAARVGDILATGQGAELLGLNDGVDPYQRVQALDLVRTHPDWTAETFTATDSVWNNPTLMQAFARPRAQRFLDERGDAPIVMSGRALENQVGFAIGLPRDTYADDESAAAIEARERAVAAGELGYYESASTAALIDPVTAQIRAVGGDDPAVTIVPVQFSSGAAGVQDLVIFRVVDKDDPDNAFFVDATGARFTDFDDWKADNQLPPGYYTVPVEGRLRARSADYDDDTPVVALQSGATTSTVDTWQEHALLWTDRAAMAGGIVAGGALLIGSGGTAAPLVFGAATAWQTLRAAERLDERREHGRPLGLDDAGARRDWLEFGTGLVSLGGLGALGRATQLSRSGVPLADLTRSANLAARANRTGAALDAATVANDSYQLIAEWDTLDGNERASLALSIGFWTVGAAAQQRLGQSASGSAGAPPHPSDPSSGSLYDPTSLRARWLDAHQDTNWRGRTGNSEYRWTDTEPRIRAGHVFEGHLRYDRNGDLRPEQATGFHRRPGGIDPEWHRTTVTDGIDGNGVYKGDVEFWDPVSQQWKLKLRPNGDVEPSSFFPDHLTESQINTAILEAWHDAGRPVDTSDTGTVTIEAPDGVGTRQMDINFRIYEVDGVQSIVSAYPVYVSAGSPPSPTPGTEGPL